MKIGNRNLDLGRSSWVLLVALALAGCSHSRPEDHYVGFASAVFAPQPPPFLKGPMGLLLTNTDVFSARATMTGAMPEWPDAISGELLGRGSKLAFAFVPEKKTKKHPGAGGLIFIWDVAQKSGFILSDTLQGYAPISSSVGFSNLTVSPSPGGPQRIEGHRCQPQQVNVTRADGTVSVLQAWRAADLNGFPVRMTSAANPLVTVNISQIRLGPPSADLFAPPDSFTKYASAEAMMTEMTIREQHLKGHPIGSWGERRPADELENRPPQPSAP